MKHYKYQIEIPAQILNGSIQSEEEEKIWDALHETILKLNALKVKVVSLRLIELSTPIKA